MQILGQIEQISISDGISAGYRRSLLIAANRSMRKKYGAE
jgi:hypothetical protein